MGKINRNNYESFLLDHLEGVLDSHLTEELLLFLDENPDIREEVEMLDEVVLMPPDLSMGNKEPLKKKITPVGRVNEKNYEEKFIAFHENDLDAEEKKEVAGFVSVNIFLKKDFKLFGKTFVAPDKEVVFAEKETLRKWRKPVVMWWLVSSVAAALIVLFAVIFLLKEETAGMKDIKSEIVISSAEKSEPVSNGQLIKDTLRSIEVLPEKSKAVTAVKEMKKDNKRDIRKEEVAKKPLIKGTAKIDFLASADVKVSLVPDVYYERIRTKHVELNGLSSKQPVDKPFIGKLFAGFVSKTKQELDLPSGSLKNGNEEPKLAKVLDGSIKVFSTITGSGPDVEKYYNESGSLIAYKVSGGQFNFSKRFFKNREKH